MATRYVNEGGSDTSPYDTEAKAATALNTALTGASASDVIEITGTMVRWLLIAALLGFLVLAPNHALAAFAYTGGATNGGNSSTASVTHGQTINSGDLVVAYVHSNSTTAVSPEDTWDAEEVDAQPAGDTARHALYWKIASGSEPSSYSWTVGNAQWRVIVKVFTSDTDAEVDAAATTGSYLDLGGDLDIEAIDGEVISDGAVSLVFGGKDNRNATGEAYTTADNSYTGVLGDSGDQVTGGAHRIYVTGTTFSGNVVLDVADGNDNLVDDVHSVHISFVESAAGGASNHPWFYIQQQAGQ